MRKQSNSGVKNPIGGQTGSVRKYNTKDMANKFVGQDIALIPTMKRPPDNYSWFE